MVKLKRNFIIRYSVLQIHRGVRSVKYNNSLNRKLPGIKNHQLWKGDRESYAKAGMVGVVSAFIPMPFQMVFSAILAYLFKANIPLSVSLAWITNPITMWPIWTVGYFFGSWLFHMPISDLKAQSDKESLFEWALHVLPDIWIPFILGNLILGLLLGSALYFIILHFPKKNDQ